MSAPPPETITVVWLSNQNQAPETNKEKRKGLLYLYPDDDGEPGKWYRLLGCPRCGSYSSPLNHRLERHDDGTVSLHASVLTKCCGAHFFIRHSRIDWC